MNRYPERIYLRRVARHLTCPRRERNRLLEQARLEIGAFCAQEGPADLRRLQQAFGQPTVFADTADERVFLPPAPALRPPETPPAAGGRPWFCSCSAVSS